MDEMRQIKVQLLCVPDCPLVPKVQKILYTCLEKTQVPVAVEEKVGAFNSPTVLVDGFDVTGQPPAEEGQTSCRLDLPNEQQILAGIRGLSVQVDGDDAASKVQAMAFLRLLQTDKCVSVESICDATGLASDIVMDRTNTLQRAGFVQIDAAGSIVGAGGLSLIPTKHELSMEGKIFWARCAFDILGIFGALRLSGFATCIDPSTNDKVMLEFVKGVLQESNLWISMGDPVVRPFNRETWDFNVSFFKSEPSAKTWIEKQGVAASLFSVKNLTAVATEACYRTTAAGLPQLPL